MSRHEESKLFARLWGIYNAAREEKELTVELARAELGILLRHAQNDRERYQVCNSYGDVVKEFPYTFNGLVDAVDHIIHRHRNENKRGDWICNPDNLDVDDPYGLTQEEQDYIDEFRNYSGV